MRIPKIRPVLVTIALGFSLLLIEEVDQIEELELTSVKDDAGKNVSEEFF